MSQSSYLKDIAKYGLENEQEKLVEVLNELIEYSKKSRRINLALQLQSILKEGLRANESKGLVVVGSKKYFIREDDRLLDELIIEKITSDYRFDNLVCSPNTKNELVLFTKEHETINMLQQFNLPVSNKLLLYGPSGCGKTLASYVLAGELERIMYVVNLGAVVSSRLGETSKNLSRIFKKAASEDCIIFIDEFDSIGKLRDYSQDHGEMKRVVNTILQLFDYMPQRTILIAATNQVDMIDEALLRRFEYKILLDLPDESQIYAIIDVTLQKTPFRIKSKRELEQVVRSCRGLSYFIIQKTLITAIKRSMYNFKDLSQKNLFIDTSIWKDLISKEK